MKDIYKEIIKKINTKSKLTKLDIIFIICSILIFMLFINDFYRNGIISQCINISIYYFIITIFPIIIKELNFKDLYKRIKTYLNSK